MLDLRHSWLIIVSELREQYITIISEKHCSLELYGLSQNLSDHNYKETLKDQRRPSEVHDDT